MNRGIARRTLFEGREDIRFFLSRLARSVRAAQLEVHAFSVMTTHFHLLVRSPTGNLALAMRQIQLDYVRRFNRTRHRDGPLVRGRFASKPVLTMTYRRTLVRYIDANPVRAGICRDAREYEFGSAACYTGRRGPPWLERSWVEEFVSSAAGKSNFDPQDYARVFGAASDADEQFVERRLDSRGRTDPLDDLVHSTPIGVLAWMRWKARLADGSEPGMAVVDPGCVDETIRDARDRGAGILLRSRRWDGLLAAHAGLLRHLCGSSLAEIAGRIGRSTSQSGALCQQYAQRIEEDGAFAAHASRLAHAAIERQHGAR
jgi:REP element-mobilizing transposase RayT